MRRFALRLGLRPRGFALITGCPRSGTSALCAWFRQQPGVAGFNESRILLAAHAALQQVDRFSTLHEARAHCLAAQRGLVHDWYARERWLVRRWIVEKEPLEPIALPDGDYDRFLAHVRELFPAARFIGLVRDPLPTIWSMRQRTWGTSLAHADPHLEWSIERCLEVWRANVQLLARLRTEPHVLVCRYETLIADPVDTSRRLAQFLALRRHHPFIAQPASTVGFHAAERARILDATQAERHLLSSW